jgi:hypothetical protein
MEKAFRQRVACSSQRSQHAAKPAANCCFYMKFRHYIIAAREYVNKKPGLAEKTNTLRIPFLRACATYLAGFVISSIISS